MKNLTLILICLMLLNSCNAQLERLDSKITNLEYKTDCQKIQLDSIKLELCKANIRIEEQSAKIDTLIIMNRELIEIVKQNHSEDKTILAVICDKITNFLFK